MERLGVIICNYNKKDDVLICIQSVLENLYQDFHVYVVDNGSSDSSVSEIKRKYEDNAKLTLLENKENLGGSGGFNTGLRFALKKGHDYLMCVDNDAMLDEDCIGKLLEFLEKNPDVGIAAAKIYHTGEEGVIQQYGSFIDYENYAVNSTYLNYCDDGTLPDVVYSDAVPACALMISRKVVDKIGVMPEENFLYWDDTEWCVRCSEAGYKVASVGNALACHRMGAKKEDVNTFPTYYAWRNWITFFLSHIEKQQLSDMAEVFLGSIFEINYSCLYRNEPNKSRTVMSAMDDALHKVMGKAGENRIFNLEKQYDRLEKILCEKENVNIISNEFPLFAQEIARKIINISSEKNVYIDKKPVYEGEKTDAVEMDVEIELCESIFRQEDISLRNYKMDLDENILATEDDVLMVINYGYSKRSFIFSYKPLFMQLAKENWGIK